MPQFVSSSELKCSAIALRAFLGGPANLPRISNPDLELEIVDAPDEVVAGATIEFRITAFGFKQRAKHEYIEVFESAIVESQIDGPLRSWRHAQRIEVLASGGCRLTDEIEFETPGGMMGYLLTEERISDSLQKGMEYRYSALQELISAGVIV